MCDALSEKQLTQVNKIPPPPTADASHSYGYISCRLIYILFSEAKFLQDGKKEMCEGCTQCIGMDGPYSTLSVITSKRLNQLT